VIFEGMLSERRQLSDQLLSHRSGEGRSHADVMERTRVVEETEEQRAHHRARVVLLPAEACDDAVRRPRVFDLDHGALAGSIGRI